MGASAGGTGAGEKLVEQAFFIPGSPVALAVSLSQAGMADKQAAFTKIRAAAASVGIPPDDLKLAGSAVAGSELNREVKNAAWNSAATADGVAQAERDPAFQSGGSGSGLHSTEKFAAGGDCALCFRVCDVCDRGTRAGDRRQYEYGSGCHANVAVGTDAVRFDSFGELLEARGCGLTARRR